MGCLIIVMTTGIGSTNAGLTCAAVKCGKAWKLEAGALVLADRGICCIDEMGRMDKSDFNVVLEAMEQVLIDNNYSKQFLWQKLKMYAN